MNSALGGYDQEETGPRIRARARYFRVLGDPTRLRLLEALLEGQHTVSELMAIVQASQSRISNHLACLKWCGLANSERRGREVVYRITDPGVRQMLELSRALSEEHREHLASCKRMGHQTGSSQRHEGTDNRDLNHDQVHLSKSAER